MRSGSFDVNHSYHEIQQLSAKYLYWVVESLLDKRYLTESTSKLSNIMRNTQPNCPYARLTNLNFFIRYKSNQITRKQWNYGTVGKFETLSSMVEQPNLKPRLLLIYSKVRRVCVYMYSFIAFIHMVSGHTHWDNKYWESWEYDICLKGWFPVITASGFMYKCDNWKWNYLKLLDGWFKATPLLLLVGCMASVLCYYRGYVLVVVVCFNSGRRIRIIYHSSNNQVIQYHH